MSQAGVIDGLPFADSASELSGTLTGEECPRLSGPDCRVGEIEFTLRGGTNPKGKPCLHVAARAELVLVCQRCLGPLPFEVVVDTELELSTSAIEIAGAEDDVDRVLATHDMDVAALVEDEVILGLPVVPKHDSCTPQAGADESKRASPFDVLARLKNGGTG
jgi:uncharacterized protein